MVHRTAVGCSYVCFLNFCVSNMVMFVKKQWNYYCFGIYMRKIFLVKPLKNGTGANLKGNKCRK
jgi:hypothetical protein